MVRKIFNILVLSTVVVLISNIYLYGNNDKSILSVKDSTWIIKKDLLVDENGNPRNDLIKEIIDRLNSRSGDGKRVTKKEFLRYFDNPESKTVYAQKLIKYATPASEEIQKKEHENFTKVFLSEKHLKDGVKFIKKHHRFLLRASRKYNVYIRDIVSILMWESGLGSYTGKYRIFNIFMGQILFLDEAQKKAVEELEKKGEENPLDDKDFAIKEKRRLDYRKRDAANSLISFLRYCKKYNVDPLKQKGSWGGAVGYVQFMPYNFKYTIDANKDGEKDLFSWPDAIMSAANFLKNYGRYTVTLKGRRRAIYAYNASKEYVDGVILYADNVWKLYLKNRK